jgi:heat shock protein HslJ
MVEEIDSTGIIGGTLVTLNFSAEGRVSGKASCNSHTGKYVLSGEGLSIGPTAATIMACDPRLMQQEKAFLARLETIRRFERAADGALLLRSEDQRSIRTRRV